MNIPPIQIATVDSSVEEEKRRPRFIISKLFALYNYIRYIFSLIKAQTYFRLRTTNLSSRSRFKDKSLSSVLFIRRKKSRETCCTTFKINSPRIRSIFLFQLDSPTFHRSLTTNNCVEFVSQENLFYTRSNIEFPPSLPPKKNFCLYPERNNV